MPRDYHQKVNKKVRRLALKSALSLKVMEDKLVVLDSFDMEKPSTKAVVSFLESINGGKKPLFMVAQSSNAAYKSVSNIPKAKVLHVDSINVYDLVHHDHLIITTDAVKRVEEVYGR